MWRALCVGVSATGSASLRLTGWLRAGRESRAAQPRVRCGAPDQPLQRRGTLRSGSQRAATHRRSIAGGAPHTAAQGPVSLPQQTDSKHLQSHAHAHRGGGALDSSRCSVAQVASQTDTERRVTLTPFSTTPSDEPVHSVHVRTQNFAYFSTACLCTLFRDAVNARPCAGFERPQLLWTVRPDQEGMPPSPTDQQPDCSEPVVGAPFAALPSALLVSSPSEWLLRRSCP
jgi:hypothetical protein